MCERQAQSIFSDETGSRSDETHSRDNREERQMSDAVSTQYADLLTGCYDCVDVRSVLSKP